jgi:pimeloyl-ACP methyl ester carboxylesterase
MTSSVVHETYIPRRVSRSRFIDVRGLACHLREWGNPSAPLVFLLHGSQDASATFQFMVDEFKDEYHLVAPDWRGHGQSGWAPGGYWYHDYLADLDHIVATLSPDEPSTLVAHSLGGNVANFYAGVRPARVRKMVSLDGFGLPGPNPAETPKRLAKWLDWQASGPEPSRAYDSVEAFGERLKQAHPRLPMDKAMFLGANTSRVAEDGKVYVAFDPKQRMPFAQPNHTVDVEAVLGAIASPTLWLSSDRPSRYEEEPGGWERRLSLVQDVQHVKVPDTTHNMHHDRPGEIARLVEEFLTEK